MTSLRNEFAFSFSSFRSFRECPRKYWISKVLAWGGWERNADPEKRLAYVLGKMDFLFALAGKIVHELAADQAKCSRTRRLPEEKLAAIAQSRFQLAIRQSHSQEWIRDPKRCANLFEHYYPGRARAATEQRAEEAAMKAARGLAKSPSLLLVDGVGVRVTVERLEKAMIAGVPTWVQVDLEIESEERYLAIDWKTGKPKDVDRMQMLLYSAYAIQARGFRLGQVSTRLDYLSANYRDDQPAELGEIQVFLEGLPGAAQSIRERLNGDGSIIDGPKENFPMTTDYRTCAACQFHAICYGQRELMQSIVEDEG